VFTGIVQGRCEIVAKRRKGALTTLSIDLGQLAEHLESGASVALNGVCATATQVCGTVATFQLVEETTTLTNLGELSAGEQVNVERSFKVGDEIGGHVLSGHVGCTARITCIETAEGLASMSVSVPGPWLKYLMQKGFIALDGASLTIAELNRESGSATVKLIPETLVRAGFENRAVGDRLNLEVDFRTQAVVDTVRELLRDKTLLREIAD
jgi:riboflavin synthase